MRKLTAGFSFSVLVVLVGAAACGKPPAAIGEYKRLNVLFIAVDDLRPQLGCYRHDEMVTPSLDRLASESRQFNNHFVQVPTCGASRFALLTGHYPAEPKAYSNDAFATLSEGASKARQALPTLFKQNGYTTVSIGKISHSPDGMADDGTPELPFSWDETLMPRGEWKDAWSAFFAYAGGGTREKGVSPVSERGKVPDEGYPDGLIADAAITKLDELKEEPFFLAVGFFKPHMPFAAPAKYWDKYDPARLPLAPNRVPPRNVDPSISLHSSGEMLGQYTDIQHEGGVVSDDEARRLRHAYCACVSYVDAQIGRVLAELDRLGLRDSTIVVLWGDHGWHLGEHGIWGKHTLHEVALRSPLLIRHPNMSMPGNATDGLVESVDIYPTLAQLCGLRAPSGLDGKSLVPMLNDPNSKGKEAVFGFWRDGRSHSIRTSRYRLVQTLKPNSGRRVSQVELYDHERDPNETVNVAADNPEILARLQAQLHKKVPLLKKVRSQ